CAGVAVHHDVGVTRPVVVGDAKASSAVSAVGPRVRRTARERQNGSDRDKADNPPAKPTPGFRKPTHHGSPVPYDLLPRAGEASHPCLQCFGDPLREGSKKANFRSIPEPSLNSPSRPTTISVGSAAAAKARPSTLGDGRCQTVKHRTFLLHRKKRG